jgi:hypothetical protein
MRALKITAVVAVALALPASSAWAASSPNVRTGPATSVKDGSAVLNGSVSADGARTSYYFQWGDTPAFGSVSHVGSLAADSKPTSVSTTAGGLVSGTVYYYRVVAQSASGGAIGATRSFKTAGTLPGASTGAAQSITKNSAMLTGVVYPRGESTSWYFQYGPGTGYGYQTSGGVVPASVAAQAVSIPLVQLQSGAIFHYRLVVQHGASASGLDAGADAFLETYPSPAPKPKLRASTSPRGARHTPVTFTTTGHLSGPTSTPPSLACAGTVKIALYLGRRRLHSTTASVQPTCTFAATESLRKLPGRGPRGRTVRLSVRIRFAGNHYLAPVSARNETVTLR